MSDRWSELARQARLVKRNTDREQMPLGFAEAVMRRLARSAREKSIDAWVPLLRPALGLAFATAFLCVLLQVKQQNDAPTNLLVETENLIELAVLE
jgi:hypothetical protein